MGILKFFDVFLVIIQISATLSSFFCLKKSPKKKYYYEKICLFIFFFPSLFFCQSFQNVSKDFSESIRSSKVKISFHPLIFKQIKTYLSWSSLSKIASSFDFFEPLFISKLRKYDVPDELRFLTLVESSLNGRTKSTAGAMGYWQFMPETGQTYGLKRNAFVNDWFNPVASSEAGAKYLTEHFKEFKDWNLTIASYNCGAGNVRKAMKKAQSREIWKVFAFLPLETQNYLIRYYAFRFIFETKKVSFRKLNKTWSQVKMKRFDGKTFEKNKWFYFLNPHILTDKIPVGAPILYFASS